MADEEAAPARPVRAVRARAAAARPTARLTLSSGPTGRPSDAENDEAEEVIAAMRQGGRLRGLQGRRRCRVARGRMIAVLNEFPK